MDSGKGGGSRIPWLYSIRLKTIIIILAMVLPIVLMGVAGTLYYQEVIKQNVLNDNLDNAKIVSALTPDYMEISQLYLESIASRPSVDKAMVENDLPFLQSTAEYANNTRQINSIYFTDSKGTVIESTGPISKSIGSNASIYPYVSQVLKTGNSDVGDAVPGLNQSSVVPITVPIKDNNGTLLGVMVGTVDLGEYANTLKSTITMSQQSIYLVNSTGHVMVHKDPAYMQNMSDFNSVAAVRNVIDGKTGAGEYYDPIDNQSMIEAYAPIKQFGWGVVVTIPQNVAYQPVWDTTWLIAMIVAVLSLLAIGSGLYLSNSIVSPITSLLKATTEAFKTHDYIGSLPLGRKDEVGDLARSFSKMVDTVKRETSEREQATKALQESEERFRALADNSPIPMAINDKDDNITYLNKKFIDTFGYTLEDIPHLSAWWSLAYPDPAYREDAIRRWENGVEEAARQSKEIEPIDYTVTCKDGSVRYTEISGASIDDKELVLLQDVTRRKLAEEALRESEAHRKVAEAVETERQRLFDVLETLPAMICLLTLDNHVAFANRAFREKFGESHGRHCYEYCYGKTGPCEIRESYEALKTGKLHHWEAKSPDGSVIEAYDFPFTDVDGTPMILEMALDVTARRRAETALKELNEALERRVNERTADLKEAKTQSELYLDLMGHDINNLNQIALGYLELAVDAIKDDGLKELVQKPFDAIQNSSKLIENVRKLQKFKNGGLKTEAIDLDGLLSDLRNQYMNVPGKNVTIDFMPRKNCRVMANGLLKDVFSNLIGNAIKHSNPSKSVWIGLGLDLVKDDGREYCKVIVEDDGPGISDVQKEMVFARFSKEKAKTEGKGLGLYLVKSLVEDFHGTVHVEDRVKGDYTKGAMFVVMLPAAE